MIDADADGVWAAANPIAEPALEEATGLFTVTGLPTNVYEFYYIVGEEPCIPDTAVIKIDISEPLTAGADGAIEICSTPDTFVDLNELLDGNDEGGSWIEVAVTGAFDEETGILDVSELPVGTYAFQYISETSGSCPADVANFIVTNWRLIWLKKKKLTPTSKAFLQFIRRKKHEIIQKEFNWYLNYINE